MNTSHNDHSNDTPHFMAQAMNDRHHMTSQDLFLRYNDNHNFLCCGTMPIALTFDWDLVRTRVDGFNLIFFKSSQVTSGRDGVLAASKEFDFWEKKEKSAMILPQSTASHPLTKGSQKEHTWVDGYNTPSTAMALNGMSYMTACRKVSQLR